MANNRVGNLLITGIAAAGLLLSLPLSAQYYDDPGLGQKPVAAHPQDYKPLGVRAGSFMLHPGIQLAAEFNDNVFYSEQDKQSDTVFHLRPYLKAQSTWSRHSLDLNLGADIARYGDYGFRDYEDYFAQISGRVDVKNRSYLSYGADYMNLHEDLNTRSSEQGREPTRYDVYGVNLGYDHMFNRLALGGMLTWRRLDYDDAVAEDGETIDNQDRDREMLSWMLRAGYQFKSDMQAFVSYTGYETDFDQALDRNGYDRSGSGSTFNGGLAFTLTGKLTGDVAAGYHDRSYDDPQLPNTSGWGGSAGLQWLPTYLTSVAARVSSGIDETTDQYASGFVRRLYSLRVDHELLRSLQINGFVSYNENDYQQIAGAPPDARDKDEIWRMGLGLSWFINRHLFLNASYDYEQLRSNVPNNDYDVNRVWLVLGLER